MKISVDVNAKTVNTDYSWQFGIGNDHAFQLLRTDVCEHIKLAHDEIGFKYIRFHGIFCDDMLVIQKLSDLDAFKALPQSDKITELSFKQIATALDNVLKCGYKPFLELSFMPGALASEIKTGLRYKNNITMPQSLIKWCVLIEKFTYFLLERYGAEEVESWYFEVWNEPDLPIFFAGAMSDYFSLYAATARTIKSVNDKLRVGGPATSACKWIGEFINFCSKNEIPYDFISTHHYPGDAFGNTVSDKDLQTMCIISNRCAENGTDMGDVLTELFYNPETNKSWKKGAFYKMDLDARKMVADKPLYITEWNSMSVYAAPVHDEKYSAAFVVKSVIDAQNITNGYMFWCCSDVFEETYNLGKPFHGSFGIVNNDGIPKPNFWAFKILSGLYRKRQDLPITNSDVEYAVFKDGNKIQILLYAQDFDPEKDNKYSLEICVNLLASSVTKIAIDDTHCNPKVEWIKLGKPDLLTPEQVKNIKEISKPVKDAQPFIISNGQTQIKLDIHTNDVVLLELQ